MTTETLDSVLLQTDFPDLELFASSKVRDVYQVGSDHLLFVATDRISAFDYVLATGIPHKGRVLTQLSLFWFDFLKDIVPNHLVTADVNRYSAEVKRYTDQLRGRSMLVRRAEMFPVECVVRGYLSGSGWKEYKASGSVCGIKLPAGLRESEALPEPIFTPATKAEAGHDENVSFATLAAAVGADLAATLRDLTLAIYRRGAEHAAGRGLILADIKLEFGLDPAGTLLLIDEVFTPDSSRYWDAATWRPGEEPASFDKQYVRNWLDGSGWDRESPPPELPEAVVRGTLERYVEAFRRLTGSAPEL